MKLLIFCFLFSLFSPFTKGQSVADTFSTQTPATVTGWGSIAKYFLTGYWEMARPQLEKKFTLKLVDSIETYSETYRRPESFTRSLENETAIPNKNDLKMYFVASFNNNYKGSFHGVVYVLWIPKAANKKWGYANEFLEHDFFILVPKESVSLSN